MTVLMGYADRISVAPGETIAFKVSCAGAPRYRAEIVRVLSPEAGPLAPPFRRETVETPANGEYPAREQALRCGSWAMVPADPRFAALDSFSLEAFIWPTLPGRGRQAIIGTWSETLGSGFGLMIGAGGALELRLGDGNDAPFVLASDIPLLTRKWYFVAASFDHASGTVRLYQELLADKTMAHRAPGETRATMSGGFKAKPAPFLFAAWHDGEDRDLPRVGGHFNGKIARPILADRALTRGEMALLAGDAVPSGLENAVVARWDFARDISSEIIRDESPNRLDGVIVNLPARAMTGHNWDGSEMNWRNAPGQYGAIHFHEDDIADARWQTDFAFTVPDDLRSGCYAAWLTAGEARFQIAFFFRPPKGKAGADIVYLASTATYTLYQNNVGRFRAVMTEVTQGRLTVLDAIDILLLEHPQMGYSTYDRHSDGSGICYSSRHRPATNIRPTGRWWNYCCDLFIVDWLDRSGLSFDIVTDDDLHKEGLNLIRPYRVLLTVSHPEYDSLAMLDALDG